MKVKKGSSKGKGKQAGMENVMPKGGSFMKMSKGSGFGKAKKGKKGARHKSKKQR